VGRFDLSPPLRPEKGVGGTRALAHLLCNVLYAKDFVQQYGLPLQ
jgi:hypothetical protein